MIVLLKIILTVYLIIQMVYALLLLCVAFEARSFISIRTDLLIRYKPLYRAYSLLTSPVYLTESDYEQKIMLKMASFLFFVSIVSITSFVYFIVLHY